MTYRVALIGAGTMGDVHARHWNAMPGAEIVGVLDPRADAARAAGPAFADWDTLISQSKPDIVDICTPTPFHREYVEKAAAAGKAIFVEKPLSRSIEDCDAMLAAVEKAGVPAMSGHVLRYFPEFAAAKRAVDAGTVGKPITIRTARMAGFPDLGGRPNWYADPAQSGGLVLDMILHDFDWLRWTFGPVTRVFAKGLYGQEEYFGDLDYALVTLRFASGAVGHVTGSWAHPGGFRTTLEIAGDAGLIEHDSDRSAPLSAMLKTKGGAGGVAVPESPMAPTEDPYYQELAAFVHALQNNLPPPVTLQDAREATRIALAALESIETGKSVTLS
ncbi:MAG: Gfo/Idh/MocA family oxidoreductase [Capsulimonas sp.]|uniref:Gfo/Idh/MocA family protein n=1 Tax=Capsulimonas sp. TaxID=2494211 RepID=UPI003263952B